MFSNNDDKSNDKNCTSNLKQSFFTVIEALKNWMTGP